MLAGAGNVQASSNPVDVKAQLANTILGGTGTAKHMLRERRQMMAAAMKAKGISAKCGVQIASIFHEFLEDF